MRRRRRSRSNYFHPDTESLEVRTLMSANIGINLSTDFFDSNNPVFTDLHNVAYPWEAPTTTIGPAAASSTIPLNSDSYPLASAATTFSLMNYPDGNYQFSYTGTATVNFTDIGQLAGPVTVSGGVTTGTVIVNHATGDGTYLDMQVTGVDPANPMANFHLMMPGYGNGTSSVQMFTPAFLATVAPFSTIRFLNWDQANNSTVTDWSDRVSPTSFLTAENPGKPYEDMIELANESQKDMWINIPALATPEFVQNLAQLIAAKLDPNLNVYVEYSNETWNNAFQQFFQVLSLAGTNPKIQPSDQYTMVEQETGYQIVAISQIFKQAFGAASARVRPILASMTTYSVPLSTSLQYIQQTFGPPSQFLYAAAVGPYITLNGTDGNSTLTLDQVFASMNKYLTTQLVPALQADSAIATQYGLPMVGYEGGQGLVPPQSGLNLQVEAQAQNDPRMYQLYLSLMTDWQQAGGGLFDAFALNGPNGGGGAGWWGMLATAASPGGQAYDALMSLTVPAGDANLDGTVDYADLQALVANYGAVNAYWRQGDFNDDGSVNWQDLNILKQNLDPDGFTLSQFAQAALFGQLSTVVPGQSLEYDGYGATYASSLAFSAYSGYIIRNATSAGTPIVLAGTSYSMGLGVLANSWSTVVLNGQYSRFESTIGVDGTASSSSGVVYYIYGDGKLLYQSPAMTYASGSIPIDINVAGVKSLELLVGAAPGTTASADHGVWADARLISTTNFGTDQPYSLTWQLSQNGTVISTQTTDSFVFGAQSGTYTLTLNVTNAQGATASASTVVTVTSPAASASNYLVDNFTAGQWWIAPYGSQGSDIVGGPSSIPNYATVAPSGQSAVTWSTSTNAPQALDIYGGPYGVAGTWYSATSFTINVNMIDGQAHDLTLYADDFTNSGRIEQIQLLNASTGAVLDSRVISAFSTGVYLQWTVTGNIVIKVTNLAGASTNAVVSALFFDPPTAGTTYLSKLDATTQGNWIGTYGSQAYWVVGGQQSLPSYATVSTVNASFIIWSTGTTDARALQNPTGTIRQSAIEAAANSFSINLGLTDGKSHLLTLYALDWGNWGTIEQIQIVSPTTGAVLSSKTLSSLSQGAYVQFVITGSVVITVTSLNASASFINGLFLDPVITQSGGAAASLVSRNTSKEGNWIGTYGAQGYDITGTTPSLPSYASISLIGATSYTWAAATTDPRALQTAGGGSRIAATWFAANSFGVDINLTDGQVHDLEMYFLDWDGLGRSESITIMNATTGSVLDTETVSSFSSGTYLSWAVSGSVIITVVRTGGGNAVLSGIFLDPAVSSTGSGASASLIARDTTTKGTWIGTYGTQGYDIASSSISLPSYATVTPVGVSNYTWSAATTDPRALQTAGGTNRIASTWFATNTFSLNISLSDGQVHDLELYFLDFDGLNRGETVTITNASTGSVLDTESVASFSSGTYLDWAISGHVVITFARTSGPNIVLSGIFFDPGVSANSAGTTAKLLARDTTTKGTWIGKYGTQGYDIASSSIKIPSYATVTPVGVSNYTWSATTTDPRALQTAGGTNRIASTWFATNTFSVNISLSDGQVHDLELYFLDFDGLNRGETVTITSASTGGVLDTESVTSFSSGIYLDWAISGSVVITFTRTSGPNIVLSGIFFDPPTGSSAQSSMAFTGAGGAPAAANSVGTLATTDFNGIGQTGSVPSVEIPTTAAVATSLATSAVNTTDPRALQKAGGTDRDNTTTLTANSLGEDSNMTANQAHDLALEYLDWKSIRRKKGDMTNHARTAESPQLSV